MNGSVVMQFPDSLRVALAAAEPSRSLRSSVVLLRDHGHDREQLTNWLELLLLDARASGVSEADEDAILDNLDFVQGWCMQEAALFPVEDALAH